MFFFYLVNCHWCHRKFFEEQYLNLHAQSCTKKIIKMYQQKPKEKVVKKKSPLKPVNANKRSSPKLTVRNPFLNFNLKKAQNVKVNLDLNSFQKSKTSAETLDQDKLKQDTVEGDNPEKVDETQVQGESQAIDPSSNYCVNDWSQIDLDL